MYGVNEGGLDDSQGSLVLYKRLIGVQGLNRVFELWKRDHGGVTGCQTIGLLSKEAVMKCQVFSISFLIMTRCFIGLKIMKVVRGFGGTSSLAPKTEAPGTASMFWPCCCGLFPGPVPPLHATENKKPSTKQLHSVISVFCSHPIPSPPKRLGKPHHREPQPTETHLTPSEWRFSTCTRVMMLVILGFCDLKSFR